MNLQDRLQRFLGLCSLLPQVYPTGPGVQDSWPHTLSVTSGIEHPESVRRTLMHGGASLAKWIYVGSNTIIAWEEHANVMK